MLIKEKSDNDLMTEFGECSFEAYAVLFKKYKNRILNFVNRGFRISVDQSEDIVQQTFIKVYESKFKYKSHFQFSTWIFTIARNKAIDMLRGMKDHGQLDEAKNLSFSTAPFEGAEKEELDSLILNALKSLSDVQREVIILRYKMELPFDEIAKITAINTNTLKSHARRGLKNIEAKLKDLNYDFA